MGKRSFGGLIFTVCFFLLVLGSSIIQVSGRPGGGGGRKASSGGFLPTIKPQKGAGDDTAGSGEKDEADEYLGDCNYTVTIGTSCDKDADTSDHVGLKFSGVDDNVRTIERLNNEYNRTVSHLDPQVLDDSNGKPFQACNKDEFKFTRECVNSSICKLYLSVFGEKDWMPEYVQVNVEGREDLSSGTFTFNKVLPLGGIWIQGNDMCTIDKMVTDLGIKSKIEVGVTQVSHAFKQLV